MKNIRRATRQIFNAPAVFRVQEKEVEEIRQNELIRIHLMRSTGMSEV
ncbi:hypothetical protein ACIMRL_002798 [Enterococcus faecalis]